jgi:DNA-binding NarL/FixJ family response regulator
MALATYAPAHRRPTLRSIVAPNRLSRQLTHALIVHHGDVVRAGVGTLLTSGSSCEVTSAGSVFEALRIATAYLPQLVLFEYTSGEGAEATRLFAGLWPRPRLVALVSRGSAVRPSDCLDAGADAAIAVDGVSREVFLSVVQRAIEGGGPVAAGFPSEANLPAEATVDDGPLALLTRREREMLYLIGEGLSNREIAESLVLSVKTVEAHRANLARKLNVRSRAGLMRLAMSAGQN